MLEYGLTVFIITIVFILGIVAFKIPILGLMGIMISLLTLTNTISSHTVIMGYFYNSTSGLLVTITQDIPELLYLGLIDVLWVAFGTLMGVLSRRN